MSILGVKKKQVDTTEIENKMARINIDLQTINTNDKELYKGINNVTLRVNNNEKMININKNKPDRKIICIYAGIDGPITTTNQRFTFGAGGESFFFSNPVKILSVSIISATPIPRLQDVSVTFYPKEGDGVSIYTDRIIYLSKKHTYHEFFPPISINAGYIIGFKAAISDPTNINILVSALIEIDI